MPPFTQDIATWYREKSEVHEGLAQVVASTLTNLLKSKKIDHLAVSPRVKSLDSVVEKMARKEYESPDEITDISGLRVITYIESDISKIAELVKDAFKVDPTKSIDKSDELRTDRFGYRSVHFICELGDTRTALAELANYKGYTFEIQIRTVLQHAWAEIEHDRSYKFSGDLPTPIRRRLNLIAGVLELADREFSALANEVDLYAKQIYKTALAGNLASAEITSLSFTEYLKTRPDLPSLESKVKLTQPLIDTAIREWKAFGLQSISDLDGLLTKQLVSKLMKEAPPTTYIGLARRTMMYSDLDRYFAKAFNRQWTRLRRDTFNFLATKYGEDKVNEIMSKNELTTITKASKTVKTAKPPES